MTSDTSLNDGTDMQFLAPAFHYRLSFPFRWRWRWRWNDRSCPHFVPCFLSLGRVYVMLSRSLVCFVFSLALSLSDLSFFFSSLVGNGAASLTFSPSAPPYAVEHCLLFLMGTSPPVAPRGEPTVDMDGSCCLMCSRIPLAPPSLCICSHPFPPSCFVISLLIFKKFNLVVSEGLPTSCPFFSSPCVFLVSVCVGVAPDIGHVASH